LGFVDKKGLDERIGFRARNCVKRRKHRTEVTEATEGDLGFVDERAWMNTLASVRETA
jgi:hypothetical protein